MYGLEKKANEKFDFDLEKDLKKNPQRSKEIVDDAEKHVQELKKMLREGHKGPELEQLGLLLHGYTALQKVIRKVK